MKGYENKKVRINVKIPNEEGLLKNLFFTAKVSSESNESHTTFEDKFGTKYTFHDEYIKEIHLLK